MAKNRTLIIFVALFFALTFALVSDPIGTYTIASQTITNSDTIELTIGLNTKNMQSGLWIDNIDIVADSLKMYFSVSAFKDSAYILVDSCMNTKFKYLDITQYMAPYLKIKAFVADSSDTLSPLLILTYPYSRF